ncbi:unnamed protein product, partial [Choristocarpus tenellus]
ARIRAGKSAFAWDDTAENSRDPPFEAAPSSLIHVPRQDQLPFYDLEALKEKMCELRREQKEHNRVEVELNEELVTAKRKLSDMRKVKRDLSAAKEVGESLRFRNRPTSFPKGKTVGVGAGRRDKFMENEAELAEFKAKDRIMELGLLNAELNKGQGELESEMEATKAEFMSTREDLSRARRRLEAIPKRFTQSLRLVKAEVQQLEQEKLKLEESSRQRKQEEECHLAVARKQLSSLKSTLSAILDEIDTVEEGRDRWECQLQVEKARANAVIAQREEVIMGMKLQYGENALECAAF